MLLLLAYPDLQLDNGPVRQRLEADGATTEALSQWTTLAALDIRPEPDGDEFSE